MTIISSAISVMAKYGFRDFIYILSDFTHTAVIFSVFNSDFWHSHSFLLLFASRLP